MEKKRSLPQSSPKDKAALKKAWEGASDRVLLKIKKRMEILAKDPVLKKQMEDEIKKSLGR
jgi:hypothetical protein